MANEELCAETRVVFDRGCHTLIPERLADSTRILKLVPLINIPSSFFINFVAAGVANQNFGPGALLHTRARARRAW